MKKWIGLLAFTLSLIFHSCDDCGFIKEESLGNNFVMSEYDNVDRRILYSEDKCSGSGIEVVPMTVLAYDSDPKWIIAKSSKSRFSADFDYWIIDKAFDIGQNNDRTVNMIKSHIYGPLDSTTFISRLGIQKINLKLKKI
jgi:hypothetical protein